MSSVRFTMKNSQLLSEIKFNDEMSDKVGSDLLALAKSFNDKLRDDGVHTHEVLREVHDLLFIGVFYLSNAGNAILEKSLNDGGPIVEAFMRRLDTESYHKLDYLHTSAFGVHNKVMRSSVAQPSIVRSGLSQRAF